MTNVNRKTKVVIWKELQTFECISHQSCIHFIVALCLLYHLTIMINLSHVLRVLKGVISQKHSITERDLSPQGRHLCRDTDGGGLGISPSPSSTAAPRSPSSSSRLHEERTFTSNASHNCNRLHETAAWQCGTGSKDLHSLSRRNLHFRSKNQMWCIG